MPASPTYLAGATGVPDTQSVSGAGRATGAVPDAVRATRGFAGLHPAVSFLLLAVVIAVTICLPHPVLLACSLAGALACSLFTSGWRATGRLLAGLVPLMLFAAALNPLFNHQGTTPIAYLGGNPITLEALQYGAALALMLVAVLLWFSCYNRVITSEKFFALFGRLIPAIALVTSMALRFVPRYLRQLRRIAAAQRGLGRGLRDGTARARLRSGFAILSILTSWAFESALDTADSMRARGYGLPGRSSYSPFTFTDRDALTLTAVLICTALTVTTLLTKVVSVQYLPVFRLNQNAAGLSPALRTGLISLCYFAFALLCLLPAALDLREELTWRILRSNI